MQHVANILGDNSVAMTLAEAARRMPRLAGRRASIATLWRWCVEGILSREGSRVRLCHVRAGRNIVTSEQALRDFATALAAAHEVEPTGAPPTRRPPRRSTRDRDAAVRAAEEELAA